MMVQIVRSLLEDCAGEINWEEFCLCSWCKQVGDLVPEWNTVYKSSQWIDGENMLERSKENMDQDVLCDV